MTRKRISAAAAGVFLAAAVLLSGCGAAGDNSSGSSAGDAAAPEQASGAGTSGTENKSGTGSKPGTDGKSGAPGAPQPPVTRAIIKTGSLTIETEQSVSAQRQKAIGIVTGLRGQVASEDTGSNGEGKITQANLVLKVPTASYETAIERLSGLGTQTAIHQESNDVTEQVVDVDSRIASQRASLNRMRSLLTKATTIGEIVSVETELTRREADLESLLAKQKNLSLQTELATLSLTIVEKGKAPAAPKDEDRGFVAGLRGGWDAFTATFSALATAIGAMLPFLIVIALIGIPLWRFRARFRRPAAPVAATATPPGTAPLPQHPDRP